MHEHYILQPTESSPGTGNPNKEGQRGVVDTQAAGSIMYDI